MFVHVHEKRPIIRCLSVYPRVLKNLFLKHKLIPYYVRSTLSHIQSQNLKGWVIFDPNPLKKHFMKNKWAKKGNSFLHSFLYIFFYFSWWTFGMIITQPFRFSEQMYENIVHTFISWLYVSLKGNKTVSLYSPNFTGQKIGFRWSLHCGSQGKIFTSERSRFWYCWIWFFLLSFSFFHWWIERFLLRH